MATIAVIGATGYAGGGIAQEALQRGHRVIGVSRHVPDEVPAGLEVRTGSIEDEALVQELAQEADVLVIAVHGAVDDKPFLVNLVPGLLEAAAAGGARLGIVGGAGSLRVKPGGPLVLDGLDFPAAFKAEADAHRLVLERLKSTETDVDWFYVSPAANFGAYAPGERTGSYRIGDDVLVTDAQGDSAISGADYAIAFVDEIERLAHHRARFTVAY
jgi:putative NADH-flavin reductase